MTQHTLPASDALRSAAEPLARPRTAPDPYRLRALIIAVTAALTMPAQVAMMLLARPGPPVLEWSAEAAALGVDRMDILRGHSVYQNTCAVCHGDSADGVPRLGKPLRNSAFVQQQTDADLFRLIADGRPVNDPLNTTRALMPPRGAQGISDVQIDAVITYLRAIQEPGAPVASLAGWEPSPDSEGDALAATAIELTDHQGYQLFVASCAACHGQGAEGIDGLGLPLTTSGFVRGKSDKDLINFIKTGRPTWDDNNTTGLDMPPKGGNPAITDGELQSIVAYIRALQKEAMGS